MSASRPLSARERYTGRIVRTFIWSQEKRQGERKRMNVEEKTWQKERRKREANAPRSLMRA